MPEASSLAMPPHRLEVCRAFGLGTPCGNWVAVTGARSHSMWSLTTDTGRYAVKVFDRITDHTRSPDWRQHLAEAIALELAAWRSGLPLPRPVPAAGSDDTAMLADVPSDDGTVTIRVHDWLEGSPLSDRAAGPELATAIGGLLANIHRLPVGCAHKQAAGLWHTHSDEYIADLAVQARWHGHAWASALNQARAAYQKVREIADQRHQLSWPLIITHRDLGPKNVLLTTSRTPVIVDWDVAGPWTAAEETASAAMEWAGALAGAPDRAAVHALISGYRAAGGTLAVPGPEVFAGWLVKNANWTEMHVRHALDDTLPERRRHAADQAVPHLIERLERLTAGAPSWASWLAACGISS